MVRQYIGARYVPKFYANSQNPLSCEWESGASYEALEIVTYLNSSYTSKKPVPATVGNPADNSEYWALTGAYNAQVEQYREEVEGYKNNVGDIEDLKTSDKTNVVNAINSLIPTEEFYLIIGDSYAMFTYTDWLDVFKEKLNLDSSNSYSQVEGGSGFNRRSNASAHYFNDLLNMAYGNISDPEKVTHIFVVGGCNDCYNEAQTGLETAIETFVTNAQTKFVNADIYCGFIGISTLPQINENMANVIRAYQNITKYDNCYYLAGVENVAHDTYFIGGNANNRVHPSEAGSIEIGNAIVESYKRGFVSCTRNKLFGGSINLSYKKFQSLQKDGTIVFKTAPGVAYLQYEVNNITLNGIGNTNLLLEYVEFTPIASLGQRKTLIPVNVQLRYDTNKAANLAGYLYLDYVEYDESEVRIGLYLNVFSITAGGADSFTDVTNIFISPFNVTMNIGEC